MEKIIKSALTLTHDWIILDCLKNDPDPDPAIYFETIAKIKEIEKNYTAEEIEAGNLLVDIW